MKTKYRVLFTLFFVLGALLLFNIKTAKQQRAVLLNQALTQTQNDEKTEISLTAEEKLNDGNSENPLRSFSELRNYCIEKYPHLASLVPTQSQINLWREKRLLKRSWLNVHLKTQDASVMRVRRFLDDGPNGSFERLVVFKEDETGFPEIVDIPQEHQVAPKEEIVQKYLAMGEVIFEDEGLIGDIDGKNVFIELMNNQVTRVDVSSGDQLLNCQSEY